MTTLSSTYPTARRTHRCSSCARPIRPGETYHRWKGTGDLWDGVATAKECADCCVRYDRSGFLWSTSSGAVGTSADGKMSKAGSSPISCPSLRMPGDAKRRGA
jgi:hypothetical protein